MANDEQASLLAEWRQGDCVVGEMTFVYRVPPEKCGEPKEPEEISDLQEDTVRGFMVRTHTCDIQRSNDPSRCWIEVCPLVDLKDDRNLPLVRKGWVSRYLVVPTLDGQFLYADLERVMTVTKEVLASWKRTQGWSTHNEGRRIADALAHKSSRVALPDEFNKWLDNLRTHLAKVNSKNTPEATVLGLISEVRVRAEPDWAAPSTTLTFYFFLDSSPDQKTQEEIDKFIGQWLAKFPLPARFSIRPNASRAWTYDEASAEEYLLSDKLDFDRAC